MTDGSAANYSAIGLARLPNWQSRSISAENPTGGRGEGGRSTEGTGARASRDLGLGWKVSPSIRIGPGETSVLADILGGGVIQHIWMSMRPDRWRSLILRFNWDDALAPAIEVPLGDFFGLGWEVYAPLTSRYVVVAPYCGLNSYWPMPFRRRATVTLKNLADEDVVLYYYIDYGLGPVPDDAAYFHAYWVRNNPVGSSHVHTIMPPTFDDGLYVGTYLAFGTNHPGWWGEGELKFYIDDDDEFPTICGTGTEDFFGGAWNFDLQNGQGYATFSAPYVGLHQVIAPDGLYQSQQRFGMYRWHEADAVRFRSSLSVTIQDLGWRPDGRYKARNDDMASTVFWYGRTAGAAPERPRLEPEHLEVRSIEHYGGPVVARK